MNEGHIASNRGLDIQPIDFEQHFLEEQVPYSNALHCKLNDQSYLAGPLARLHLNNEQLTPIAQEVLSATQLSLPFRKSSQGIVARSLEVLNAIEEARQIIDTYDPPEIPQVLVNPQAGVGMAATEAPRGLLYHRYHVNHDGTIQEAKIVPPTSQNQRRIEEDLRAVLPHILDRPDDEVALHCEKIVRHYDPCISCATHFLQLHIREVNS